MENKMAKFSQILMYVLMGISSLLVIIMFYNSGDEVPLASIDAMIYWTYALFFLISIVTIIAVISYFFKYPKQLKSTIFIIIGAIVIYAISYIVGSDNIDGPVYEAFKITKGTSKVVDSFIILTYIIGAGSIGTLIYSGIYSLINNNK